MTLFFIKAILIGMGENMAYKILGSALLCLAGVISTVYISKFQKNKLVVTDAFISLIFYIKGQVDCYSKPIGEILIGAPREILKNCRYRDDARLIDMVEKNRAYLSDEGYRLMYSFASEFGSTYREEQMKRCDYYIEAMSEERKNMAHEIPDRSRVYSALVICSSLCLIIMLW